MTVHQRESVVGLAGANARNKATGNDRIEGQDGQHDSGALQFSQCLARRTSLPRRQQVKRHPHHRDENQESQRQMGSQAKLADPRIIHQTALDHVPAHRALQAAKNENTQQLGNQWSIDFSPKPEVEKWQEKDGTDESSQHTMPVLPEENALELVKFHLVIDFLILGRFLVFFEGFIPFALIQRRNDADDGLPLDDRQPGMGEPRNPANHKNGKHHGATDKQPEGNLSPGDAVHSSTPEKNR